MLFNSVYAINCKSVEFLFILVNNEGILFAVILVKIIFYTFFLQITAIPTIHNRKQSSFQYKAKKIHITLIRFRHSVLVRSTYYLQIRKIISPIKTPLTLYNKKSGQFIKDQPDLYINILVEFRMVNRLSRLLKQNLPELPGLHSSAGTEHQVLQEPEHSHDPLSKHEYC